MNVVDYSWARPGAAAIRAAGFNGVMRYVPYPGDLPIPKGIYPAELEELRADGLSVGLVFESSANRALDGRDAGIADANATLWSRTYLKWPEGLPTYFAVDFDLQASQYNAVAEYFRGVNSVFGAERTGVYGGSRTLELISTLGLARYFWQSLGWRYGVDFPGRHLFQYGGGLINGGEVDYNRVFINDFGQWLSEEEEMPDPRVDKLVAAMGGEAAVDAWNARGNSLLKGYAIEQDDQNVAEAEVARLTIEVAAIQARLAAAAQALQGGGTK